MRRKNRSSLDKVICKETLMHYVLQNEKRQVNSNCNPFSLEALFGHFLMYFSLDSSQSCCPYQISKVLMRFRIYISKVSHTSKQNKFSTLLSYHCLIKALILLFLLRKLPVPSLLTISISCFHFNHTLC